MKRLYFVRHGEAEMNAQGVFAGRTETPLTEKGREQARLAGEEAKALGIDLIISSPLSRAHDTAKIIAETIGYPVDKIELSDLLLERSFGSAEGQIWAPDFDMESVADCEPLHELQDRLEQFWQYVQTLPAENILVSSHGSAGRMFRHVCNPDIPFHGTALAHHLPNAHIVQLV
jgi:broad specificity phosphatase PhoE